MNIVRDFWFWISLVPIGLLSVNQESVKTAGDFANTVTFEVHKLLNFKQYFDFRRQLAGVQAEACADELQEFLLDDKLHIKKEYIAPLEGCPDAHKYFMEMLKLIVHGASRGERVTFRKQQTLELSDKYEQKEAKQSAGSIFFVVIAKKQGR